jgi:hypothetical protein
MKTPIALAAIAAATLGATPAQAQLGYAMYTQWIESTLNLADCKRRGEIALRNTNFAGDFLITANSVYGRHTGGYTVAVRCIDSKNTIFFVLSGPKGDLTQKYLKNVVDAVESGKTPAREQIAKDDQDRLARERLAQETEKLAKERERLAALERERSSERERIAKLERERAADRERLAALERDRATERERLSALKQLDALKQTDTKSAKDVAAPMGRRVALVIGNSNYSAVTKLANPQRDAATIAATLRKVGFVDVVLLQDLSKQAMERALIDFTVRTQGAEWAVVYYAGHGMEMDGQNYLIPVDAHLKQDRHVRFETVPLDDVLEALGGARQLKLIILDACRNNPFTAQMTRTVASRSIGRGLAQLEPSTGSYVAYAAKHGQVALDGTGNNSPFVSALVKHLQEPGVDVRLMFSKVRDTVMSMTNNAQQPFTYGSLPGVNLSFRPGN